MKRPVKRHEVVQPLSKPYRFIPLTQGQNAIVDTKDYDWLMQWNWCAQWNPNTKSFYAMRSVNFGKGIFRLRQMASEILKLRPGKKADHKNHDTLDNRRENIRKATSSQNGANGRLRSNNTSGFIGVSRNKGAWTPYITHMGIRINLGRFQSKKAAALAYDVVARKLHGEFAHLNFPNINYQ